jgi:hypothetical protein
MYQLWIKLILINEAAGMNHNQPKSNRPLRSGINQEV